MNYVRFLHRTATHIDIVRLYKTRYTCWAEEEHIWLVQVRVNVIGDRHLGVGKGGKLLRVSRTHVAVDVIKQYCKGTAAQSRYLPTRICTNNSGLPMVEGRNPGKSPYNLGLSM